jgi:hypothetical protein
MSASSSYTNNCWEQLDQAFKLFIHELHSKKLDGVLFKIDFEKTYDKVKWPFLQQVLRMKGFDKIWCDHIRSFVERGSVGIKVNDDIGHNFQTRKGLRQ